jgi:hypothetical protein
MNHDEIPPRSTEPTCGQELAAAAEVPEKWRQLMEHVAHNLEGHALWVGSASDAARDEHQGLLRVALAYRAMAAAAADAAAAMIAMKDLAPAPHDPSRIDRPAQASWMRVKIQLQRELGTLITTHARESEEALAALGRVCVID